MANIKDIKLRLTQELQREQSDSSLIISLSNEIAKYDDSKIRFSVDAGIINRLGKELVGRHETAVSELVKNSYDADASEVKLFFKDAWQPGGTLIIEDNGHGMNRQQLIDGFMRLSSADKLHNPISPKYERIRAGRKGIGRFATQRLGNKLTIITQTSDSEEAIRVKINWSSFESDKDLSAITNYIEYFPKNKEEGTDLIIEDLREGWSDPMIKRVFRYTSDLLQPFPLSKKRYEQEGKRTDPGFKSSYFRVDGKVISKIIDEEEAFLNYALAEIEGYVLEDGQGCWALKSEKLNFEQEVYLIGKYKDDPQTKFNLIKGVHFKCFYFIYDSSLLPKQTMSLIREVANERGGIRVYRNGFRVLPYGEKLNDWLGLDDSTARRVILASHRNINFFGFVELTDSSGIIFDETSSREGLFENEAFVELVNFIQRSIVSGVIKVAELRERKATTSQKDWVRKEKTPTEKVDDAILKIKSVFQQSSKSDQGPENEDFSSKKEEFEEAFNELIDGRSEEKEEKKQLINELNMMRILAGLGLVIGEFVHEIKNYFPGINAETNFLRKALKDHTEGINRVNNLEKNFKAITTYSAYFDESISRNVFRELEPIELHDVVNRFIEVIQNNLDKTHITMAKPVFSGFDLFTIPMHPSEWSSILFNFFTNAKKAIRRKGVPGEMMISCGRENEIVFLEFSDNGDGIPKENEVLIFNAFYTTSTAAGHDSPEIETYSGTGLGLKIVKDIVESYNGRVYIVSPSVGYSTTIRVEIPKMK